MKTSEHLPGEPLSDALFHCVYTWINGHVCEKAELRAAGGRHSDRASPYGALAVTLAEIHALSYEALCGRGFCLTDTQKQRQNRQALVAGIIGEAQVKALLCDTARIHALFPPGATPVQPLAPPDPKVRLNQMAASQRGALLAAHYGQLSVNPDSGTVYRYTGALWEKVPDSDLCRTLVEIFNQHQTPYSPTSIARAVEAMKLQLPLITPPAAHLIGFLNGVYDLQAGEFRAHNARDGLQHHNGILFTPAQPGESLTHHAPHFSRWLGHVSQRDPGKAERLKAALFMVLANRYDWQLFIEVTGEGGSGKSVFTRIAALLAGEHNTASGNMKALDEARGRAQFVGKRVILLPDQTRYVGEGAGIKAITGGDLVEIDGKYEKQFSTVLQAVVLATNNEPMTFTERQGGIARRRVIFPFDQPVPEADKDPLLADNIAAELPVIIRHLLARFADQNDARTLLTEQRDSAEAMHIKKQSDPLYNFCAHMLGLEGITGLYMGNRNITPRKPRIYLYHAYLTFLDAHGYDRPLTLTKFGADLTRVMKEFGVAVEKVRTRQGMRYNLDLSPSAEEWLPAVPLQALLNDPPI